MDVVAIRDQRRLPPFFVPLVLVSSSLIVVTVVVILAFKLNYCVNGINLIVDEIKEMLPEVHTLINRTNVLLPNANSLVIQVDRSLPIYTNAVAALNTTLIEQDITMMASKLANISALANRIAAFFHL